MKQLMEDLGASLATLNRDLEYLRSRMDAPIVYDRFLNGYVFQVDSRDHRQATHQLPGVWFSESEIHALLTMRQLISGLDEGGVLARHLQPLLDKLTGMLGTTEAETRELMKRIKIVSSARRPVPTKFFELVCDALLHRGRLRMRYLTRSRGEVSEREVSPPSGWSTTVQPRRPRTRGNRRRPAARGHRRPTQRGGSKGQGSTTGGHRDPGAGALRAGYSPRALRNPGSGEACVAWATRRPIR